MPRKTKTDEPRVLRMRQIIACEWSNGEGGSYSVVGLSENGCVYRYDIGLQGWIAWPMGVVEKERGNR